MSRSDRSRQSRRNRPLPGRRRSIAVALATAFLSGRLVFAQPDAGEEATAQELFDLLGISCGSLVILAIASIVWWVISIALGARLAGLNTTIGRAFMTPLAALLLALPLGVLVAIVSSSMSQTGQLLIGQAASSLASLLAIKWVFRAPWGNALLAFLLASIIAAVGILALLVILF